MWINGERQPLRDRKIHYHMMPGKIGGSSLGPDLFWWFCAQMGLEKNRRYLEIGTFDGLLLSIMAELYQDKVFYAIDPFKIAEGTASGHWHYFEENNKGNDNVHIYQMKSEQRLPMLYEAGERFDLIFIDGDHSYEAISIDLEWSWKLLNPGCMIILHDISLPGTIQACKEFEEKMGINFTVSKYAVNIFTKE